MGKECQYQLQNQHQYQLFVIKSHFSSTDWITVFENILYKLYLKAKYALNLLCVQLIRMFFLTTAINFFFSKKNT